MSDDAGKIVCAERAVSSVLSDLSSFSVIGIGSGSTIVHAISALAQRYQIEKLDIVCIPSSFQTKELIISHKLPLGDIDVYNQIDIYIDGADEIDENLNLIKGGGYFLHFIFCGCLTREKILAYNSKKFLVIADERKACICLGEKRKQGVPIEVIPFGYKCVMKACVELGYTPVLRMDNKKAGPIITDNGGLILDLGFDHTVKRDWLVEDKKLKMIPGVVETGLFINMCSVVVFGRADNTAYTVPLIETGF